MASAEKVPVSIFGSLPTLGLVSALEALNALSFPPSIFSQLGHSGLLIAGGGHHPCLSLHFAASVRLPSLVGGTVDPFLTRD